LNIAIASLIKTTQREEEKKLNTRYKSTKKNEDKTHFKAATSFFLKDMSINLE